jgi:hypothetical protein
VTFVPKLVHSDGKNPMGPRKEPHTYRRYLPIGDSSAAYLTDFWCDNQPRINRNLGLLSLILFPLHG